MKKYVFRGLSFVLLLLSLSLAAQEAPRFTQYLQQPLLLNAAYAGTLNDLALTTAYRSQWVSIPDAPRTFLLSGEYRITDTMGVGLTLYNDAFGPSSRSEIRGHYAYNLRLGETVQLRLGLNAQLLFYDLNTSEINAADAEQNLFGSDLTDSAGNLGLGTLVHGEQWFLGFSIPTLFETEALEGDTVIVLQNRSYNLMAGYAFPLGDHWTVKPSVLFQKEERSATQYNITTSVAYKNKVLLGLNYGLANAVSGIVGFQLTDGIRMAYSYDAAISDISSVSGATHEVSLRFNLTKNPISFVGRD